MLHQPERGCRARAEALGEALGDVLARREVDDLLGLDHLARDVVDAAERVGESELDALLRRSRRGR